MMSLKSAIRRVAGASLMSMMTATAGLADVLPVEEMPSVQTLPKQYPANWLLLHDLNFFSLIDGKVVVVDVTADNRNYKGAIGAAQFASVIRSAERQEIYVAETFYSRGTRGTRTDVVTIYDTATLSTVGEIVLPDAKRALTVTQKGNLRLTQNQRYLLVFNFTPAASVTIIDLETRAITSEVDVPGCMLTYPMGKQGFASLCGDGTMISFQVDDAGQAHRGASTEAFNNLDDDPLFMKSVNLNGIEYFPSFKGRLQAVDLKGEAPVIGKSLSLIPAADKGWRPGGWQIIAGNGSTVWLLVHPDGVNGSHKNGGSEVWSFDVTSGKRLSRVTLKNWGVSIEVAGAKAEWLAVGTASGDLDVYNSATGAFERTIGGRMTANPMVMHNVTGSR
ncbi:amine dehydrogenase large subunit [Gimibacter soli]|uniref:Amine dehydrogenase large subunit n=1 Tax=Gimibacter soli TaxID=3024400 RepID=A0AAF0BLG3_9PROT|nr:amine dehydrogenase large subunit [Gimibacter soli]WCL53400.1 amine dehydrogenase large subunit [Gimibacter soli]